MTQSHEAHLELKWPKKLKNVLRGCLFEKLLRADTGLLMAHHLLITCGGGWGK